MVQVKFPQRLLFGRILSILLICTSVQSEKQTNNNFNSLNNIITKNSLQTTIIQTLIDIYVFTNSSNDLCRNASILYHDAILNFDSWALKMLDSSSKLQSGLMAGNLIEYGSYTQCINIHYDNTKDITNNNDFIINGKHCMLILKSSEEFLKKLLSFKGINDKAFKNVKQAFLNSTIEWSLCIPDACGSQDIKEHFENLIRESFEGLDITLDDNIPCSVLSDIEKPFTTGENIVFGIIIFLSTLVIFSTTIEIYKIYRLEEPGYEIIFSIISNSRWLITQNKSHQQMACLNGIRVLSIIFVICGHRFLMSVFFSAVNTFDFIDWLLHLPSQIVIGGTVSVDSFLLLSGLLLTYHFLLSHENGHKFNLLLYYLHRYLRLTPSYGFTILIIVTFGHRFGMGPKWEQSWRSVQEPCAKYWWSALLYIQSYVNPKEMCILQSWYLSIDTFYYVFAPLILIPLVKYPGRGFLIISMVYFTSVAVNFQRAYKNAFVVHALLDNHLPSSEYFSSHYTQPHIRASPYIIGMVLGYILFKVKDKKVVMSKWTVIFGWIACGIVMVTVILSNRIFLDPNYVYDKFGSSLYIAVHRSAWALAISWIIWACVHGYAGPVNTFLSSQVFDLFGKLTYSAYLVHMPFQYFDNGANKLPNYFSNLSLIRKGFGDIGISFFIGYFLTILVECPVYRLSLILFKGKKKVNSKRNINTINGTLTV